MNCSDQRLVTKGLISGSGPVPLIPSLVLLTLQLLHSLQAGPHQVGPEIEQTELGVGHIGDGVDGVQDGVLPGESQSSSDERSSS